MDSLSDLTELRVTSDSSDDPNYAATQTLPTDTVELRVPVGYHAKTPPRIKVEVVVEWLDSGGDVVTTDRGSFDVQAIRVTTRRGPLQGPIVVDSATLTGQIAHRPVVIDDVFVGDTFTVRLTNITPASGADRARVLYREII